MPRDWRKRKKTKDSPAAPLLDQHPTTPSPVQEPSPAAQIVFDRIGNSGPDYLMENMIRVLTHSSKFAEEPEFAGLVLDSGEVVQITEKWLDKYKSRLKAAEKKGEDEYHQVLDDMRIEVINELAVPAFRKEVKDRLQKMIDRLMTGKDQESLEIALLLQLILKMKQFPWGVCGLVVAIYNRALDQEVELYEEQKDLSNAFMAAITETMGDSVDFKTLIKSPEKLHEVGDQLAKTNPDLMEVAEKQAWKMIEAFEGELMRGIIDLPLFTDEEVVLPIKRLEAQFRVPFEQIPQDKKFSKQMFDTILQTIDDIMTPARYQRFRKDVESTRKTWMREKNKWAMVLEFELVYLDKKTYEQNKFIIAAFMGQFTRLGD